DRGNDGPQVDISTPHDYESPISQHSANAMTPELFESQHHSARSRESIRYLTVPTSAPHAITQTQTRLFPFSSSILLPNIPIHSPATLFQIFLSHSNTCGSVNLTIPISWRLSRSEKVV